MDMSEVTRCWGRHLVFAYDKNCLFAAFLYFLRFLYNLKLLTSCLASVFLMNRACDDKYAVNTGR